jgi:hypothetical protein
MVVWVTLRPSAGPFRRVQRLDRSPHHRHPALRALTTDGRQLWQQPLSTMVIGPDLYGGVLVGDTGNPAGVKDFDGQTGSPIWGSNFASSTVAVRTDGNIVGLGLYAQQLQQPPPNPPISVFVVNGATGQTTQIPMPEMSISVTTSTGNCGSNGTHGQWFSVGPGV